MGNTVASPSNPRFAMASRAFTKQELVDLETLFNSLAAQSQSSGKFVSQSMFQGYFGIKGALGSRMFEMVTQSRDDGMLTYEDLVIAKGAYEKGSPDEIDEFIYQLCDVDGDGTIGRSDMKAVWSSIYETIFSKEGTQTSLEQQNMEETFLSARVKNEGSVNLKDFKIWCRALPSAKKFLGSLLMNPDSGRPGFQVPILTFPENLSSDAVILKKEYAWQIGGALPQNELEEWRLLYHSGINGLSFNTFMGNVSSGDGPTVLVIKDTEGYIYGGYASQPWERQSDFYGDMKSFVFQLYPQASIYRPTGANSNLQWCAINFSSDSIPNGIGFGGKANHFGLFISANFDLGHTFECTTFNSPCLSKTNKIKPEVLECWGIKLKGAENEKNDAVKGSVLERFKEDRNMLKMVGLASSSE